MRLRFILLGIILACVIISLPVNAEHFTYILGANTVTYDTTGPTTFYIPNASTVGIENYTEIIYDSRSSGYANPVKWDLATLGTTFDQYITLDGRYTTGTKNYTLHVQGVLLNENSCLGDWCYGNTTIRISNIQHNSSAVTDRDMFLVGETSDPAVLNLYNSIKTYESYGWSAPTNETWIGALIGAQGGYYPGTYDVYLNETAPTPPPPVTTSCNLTAIAQNTANGNAVAGSTFHIYDITKGTSEDFYLPFGVGLVSIPYMYDYYFYNATAQGYTGYMSWPGVDQKAQIPYPPNTCAGITLSALLTGPPQSVTNGTLDFWIHDTSTFPLAIVGAIVTVSNTSLNFGQTITTNNAGAAQFNLLILNQSYEYMISKTGYYSVESNVTMNQASVYISVPLTQGIQPTATITPGPTTTQICPVGDIACKIGNSLQVIGNLIDWIVNIVSVTMMLTLIFMFIFVASGGLLAKWGWRRGGGGGGLIPSIKWR